MAKILLVEDDKSLREIYGVRLLAEGYDIVSAGDGEEALAMAIKERPALIVSDVMMPKISGFDMLDILRSTTETKDVKVIMMTALSSEDQRQRGEQLGADRYLVKSQVGIEDVVRTVHEVLGDLPQMAAQPASRPTVDELSPQPAVAQPGMMPPMPQPVAPPTVPSATQPAPAASLPRPTAPFSSSAPRPSNLGERVIHPLSPIEAGAQPDLTQMIEQELHGMTAQPTPVVTQPAPEVTAPTTAPEPPAIPQPPQPAAAMPELTAMPVTPAPAPGPQPSVVPPQPAPTPEVAPASLDNAPMPQVAPMPTAPPNPQPPANAFPTQSSHV